MRGRRPRSSTRQEDYSSCYAELRGVRQREAMLRETLAHPLLGTIFLIYRTTNAWTSA
jgi:hypothetical protein